MPSAPNRNRPWLPVLLAAIVVVAIVEYGLRATDPLGTWLYNGGHPGAYVFAELTVAADGSATLQLQRFAKYVKPGGGAMPRTVHKVHTAPPPPVAAPIPLSWSRSDLGFGLVFSRMSPPGPAGAPYATGRVSLFPRMMRLHIANPSLDVALTEAQEAASIKIVPHDTKQNPRP